MNEKAPTPRAPARDVQWLDGLRGLASFSVVCTHIARAVDDKVFFAADGPDATPRFVQWPFFRIIPQGKIGVAIFAFLTGYVCALKPLRLARQGKQDAALSAIAKGVFRRVPRLVIPATVALVIAWALCQLGAFTAATRGDSEWLRLSSPVPAPSIATELWRLWQNFWWTWSGDRMEYDDHQWTMLPLLQASFTAFLLVAALVYTRFQFRVLIYLLLIGYFWQDDHPESETFGLQATWGVLLCDLNQSPAFQRITTENKKLGIAASFSLVWLGLYFASFPILWMSAPWVPWSRGLLSFGWYIFPTEIDSGKRFTSLGVQSITLGLQVCPSLQQVLSHRLFLRFGKSSFAVYLIHGTLLKTVLAWALYGISGQPWKSTIGDDGLEIPPPWLPRRFVGVSYLVVVAIWMCLVWYCAHLWTTYVDAWAARVTQRIEDLCTEPAHRRPPPQISQA